MDTIVLQNTDPAMRGQLITRNGKSYRINAAGLVEVPADSGLHLCGKQWRIVKGEPQTRVVRDADGRETIMRVQGPMVIWKGPAGHVEGQKLGLADGSVVRFNNAGYGMAADNCGWEKIKGFSVVGPATPENIAKYAVEMPRSANEVEQDVLDELLMAGLDTETEVDPYEVELARINSLPVVPSAKPVAGLDAGHEGAEGGADSSKLVAEAQFAQAVAEGRVYDGHVYKTAGAAKSAQTRTEKAQAEKSALEKAAEAAGDD